MSHDDVMSVYHLLEPLFVFPDANVPTRREYNSLTEFGIDLAKDSVVALLVTSREILKFDLNVGFKGLSEDEMIVELRHAFNQGLAFNIF